MKLLSCLCFAVLFAAQPTWAAELGSNLNPYSFGTDQTIVDISKVVWQPLVVKGLHKGAEIAVLRGSLTKGSSEILLRFPPGYVVPMHDHTAEETYIWLSGAFTLIGHDGKHIKFDGPTFISFPGNAPPHGLVCGGKAPCVLYVRYSRPFNLIEPHKMQKMK